VTIICVGDVMLDVGVALPGPLALGSDTPAVITVGHGGSAANTAAWAASTGARVQFFGRVGADLPGREVETELLAQNVEACLARDPSAPTGTCIVMVGPDGERTMIPSAGANEHIDDTDLANAMFSAADLLHVSGYMLLRQRTRAAALEMMDRAVAAGAALSIDASSAQPLRQIGPEQFLSWLPAGCLLIANLDEAAVLSGMDDPERAAATLCADAPTGVVVKCGSDGAVIAGADGCVRVAARPVTVVDTTGAGDAFAGGLLAGLAAGWALPAAAERGADLAAIAVTRWGARP
jgi:ribokinase